MGSYKRLKRARDRKRNFPKPEERYPFPAHRILDEKTGDCLILKEEDAPVFDDLHNGPIMASIILMAFERAYECGGWRAQMFIKWMGDNLGKMQVELVEKIENRLHQTLHMNGEQIKKSHKPIKEIESWRILSARMRAHLYDK